jgi:hypothetical protein
MLFRLVIQVGQRDLGAEGAQLGGAAEGDAVGACP